MRTALYVLAAAASAAAFSSPAAAAEEPPPRRLVVVGDSITARANNIPGDPNEGWWSIVGREIGHEPVKVARSGVGFLRKQPDCRGIRFGGMLKDVVAAQPHKIIVAGGRNDWRSCSSRKHVSRKTVRNHIFWYFRALNARLPEMGLTPADVYTMSPWGEAAQSHSWIRGEVKRQGEKFGFTFIPTGTVNTVYRGVRWTSDGTHLTTEGHKELARRVLKYSDLRNAA